MATDSTDTPSGMVIETRSISWKPNARYKGSPGSVAIERVEDLIAFPTEFVGVDAVHVFVIFNNQYFCHGVTLFHPCPIA